MSGIKKFRKCLLFLLCLNVSSTFSATQSAYLSMFTHGHFIFTLGGYQGKQGETQHIDIQDLIGDTFSVSHNHDNNALLGLGYFLDGQHWNKVQMSYGINAFYLAPTAVSGYVTQEDLFTNLSYSYRVTNFPLFLVAKTAIYLNSPQYALTFDVGAGPNFMKLYDFHENSLDGGITIPDQSFSSNTNTTFSTTFGAGIKMDRVLGQLALECGYRFFYLGEGNFTINNSLVLNSLKTGNTYANAIQCSVST